MEDVIWEVAVIMWLLFVSQDIMRLIISFLEGLLVLIRLLPVLSVVSKMMVRRL